MKMEENRNLRVGEALLKRALEKSKETEDYLDKNLFWEAVAAAQECLEYSVKALMWLLGVIPRREHKPREQDFAEVLNNAPDELKDVGLHKLYLYSKLWSSVYTIAKYGSEGLGYGPHELFEKEDAKLAIKHAKTANSLVNQVLYYIKSPW